MPVTVQFVGSGDAFGSGGRFQACISLIGGGAHFLLDCGASSLVALKRFGLDPSTVDVVLVTHLHGDHFGGVPFLVLDGQFSRRKTPLIVAGPPGLQERTLQAMEVLYPGSSRVQRQFSLEFLELLERTPETIGPAIVSALEVPHGGGAPAYALRVALEDRLIAYSGDTAWSETLIQVANGADLFICEAYSWDRSIRNHLSHTTLREHRSRMSCRRLVLTHMGPEMLAHAGEAMAETAEDGMVVEV